MAQYRIAVFASGEGTNFQALVDAARNGEIEASVDLLVCDKPAARVVQRAEEAGVACHLFTPKNYASREDYETEIVDVLESRNIDLVVLAGYMRLLTSVMVDRYAGRLINIHPSLLPAFPGKDAIGQAMDYGVKVTGLRCISWMEAWIPGRLLPSILYRFCLGIRRIRLVMPFMLPRSSSILKWCPGSPKVWSNLKAVRLRFNHEWIKRISGHFGTLTPNKRASEK